MVLQVAENSEGKKTLGNFSRASQAAENAACIRGRNYRLLKSSIQPWGIAFSTICISSGAKAEFILTTYAAQLKVVP